MTDISKWNSAKGRVNGNTEDAKIVNEDQFDLYVANLQAKKGIDYAPGTVTNWKITQGHLKAFLEKKCKRNDIPLKDLGVPFLADLDFFAKTVWKCGNNAALWSKCLSGVKEHRTCNERK